MWIFVPLAVFLGLLMGQQKCPKCNYGVLKNKNGNYTLGHNQKCQNCGLTLTGPQNREEVFEFNSFGHREIFAKILKLRINNIKYASVYWRSLFRLGAAMIVFTVVVFSFVKDTKDFIILFVILLLSSFILLVPKCPNCGFKKININHLVAGHITRCPECNFDLTKNYSRDEINKP